MNLINFDKGKSLEELEIVEGSQGRGSMVSKSNKLRKKPVKDFTTEELRMMIMQNRNLKFLVPLAIERLIEDPLLKGDLYAGDLTNAVLTIEKKFWINDLNGYIPMLNLIIDKAQAVVKENPQDHGNYIENISQAIRIFKANIALI